METINDKVLYEATVFEAVASTHFGLKSCSDRCRRSLRNGPNYQKEVSVCTSKCKISQLNMMIHQLQKMKGAGGMSNRVLNTKLMYLKNRLNNEIMKLKSYRFGLKKRQTTIPVSMSLKPSPERYNIGKIS